ncbi:MAG: hypothetical protein ABI564_13665 [Ideonella sp.]
MATIAHRYRVSEGMVAQWNKTSAHAKFARGQTIIVYVPQQSGSHIAKGRSGHKGKVAASAAPRNSAASSRVAGKRKPAAGHTASRSSKGSSVAQSGKSQVSQIKY